MHRAGQRSVACSMARWAGVLAGSVVALGLSLGLPVGLSVGVPLGGAGGVPAAWAYHTGATFDRAPGAGGGGGLFYTGAPRERGWTCEACHVDPPVATQVVVRIQPAELLVDRVYVPGQSYDVTVTLENEQLGRMSARSNFNGMAMTVMDESGAVAGDFSGFAAEDFYVRGRSIIASSGTTVGATEWSFRWTAPEAGRGEITLYLGVVDGNGANSPADVTLTDPFGDGVFIGYLAATESSAAPAGATVQAGARARSEGAATGRFTAIRAPAAQQGGCAASPDASPGMVVLLALLVLLALFAPLAPGHRGRRGPAQGEDRGG
jgi:hypothetical protein